MIYISHRREVKVLDHDSVLILPTMPVIFRRGTPDENEKYKLHPSHAISQEQ